MAWPIDCTGFLNAWNLLMRPTILIACLIACLLAGVAFAAEGPTSKTLYKSVGPDGRIVYSDRRPDDGGPATALTLVILPGSPLSAATLEYIEQLRRAATPPASRAQSGEIVLFSAGWCPYCKKAKAYLASKAIVYREVDIDTKDGMVAFAQAGGGKGVPLLLANGRQVSGFSPTGYDAALATHQ